MHTLDMKSVDVIPWVLGKQRDRLCGWHTASGQLSFEDCQS